MLNLTQPNANPTVTDAHAESTLARWRRTLGVLLDEHALSHRAAASAALHRRSATVLRKLYSKGQRRAHEMSRPLRAAKAPGQAYLVPSRHSFGR